MKNIRCFFYASAILTLAISCGGNNGKKFMPEEVSPKLSDKERSEKLQELKDQKALDFAALLNPHDLQISILVPVVNGSEISAGMGEKIAVKMLQIASENGISGLGLSSAFALGAEVHQLGAEVTGTAPQRMVVKYEINFKVINTADETVYTTCSQEFSGAGNSFEQANRNAISDIKNTPKIQKMLSQASERIIEWYNENLPSLKLQVEAARGVSNFLYALALVKAVPQKATEAFTYAQQIQPKLIEEYKNHSANENFQAMVALISSSNEDFNPEIGGYFSLIPADSPQFAKAKEAYNAYEAKCKARLTALEAKAEKNEAEVRQLEILRMNLDQQKELAKIEADKVVGKAEANASAAAMERDLQAQRDKNKGFWGKLGSRVLNGIDAVSSKFINDDED